MSNKQEQEGYNHIDPATKKRMIGRASFLLFNLGLSQKAVAKDIGVTPPTLCNWVRDLGWRDKLAGRDRATNAEKMKFTDSLSAFMGYLSKKHKGIYPDVEKAYKEFIKKY